MIGLDSKLNAPSSLKWVVISEGTLWQPQDGNPWRPLEQDEWDWFGIDSEAEIYMGEYRGHNYGLACISADKRGEAAAAGEFIQIRSILSLVYNDFFPLLAKGLQLENWWTEHKFCGHCGTENKHGGNGEYCQVCQKCDRRWFPRIAPCAITVPMRKNEILLARNVNFPEGMFSALAGFCEVGENTEETAAREIYEETQIKVCNVRYVGSQSWPFPSQLMLGYLADYDSGEIQVDGIEIAEAKWFNVSDLPKTPPRGISISSELIELAAKEALKN